MSSKEERFQEINKEEERIQEIIKNIADGIETGNKLVFDSTTKTLRPSRYYDDPDNTSLLTVSHPTKVKQVQKP